jgi:hypothetical protein
MAIQNGNVSAAILTANSCELLEINASEVSKPILPE